MRKLSRKRKLGFTLAAGLLAAASLEGVLYLACGLSSRVDLWLALPGGPTWQRYQFLFTQSIPDDQLGYRPNPAHPEHDAKGFRNRAVPKRAQIVTLGDSQTYGHGVAPAEAWPQLVSQQSGESVYNLAYGGYGPVHSLLLLDEALALRPKIVLEGFYAGNDIADTYRHVYAKGIRTDLKSTNPDVARTIADAEVRDPSRPRFTAAQHIYAGDFGQLEPATDNTAKSPDLPGQKNSTAEASFDPIESIHDFLAYHSKIYGVGRGIKNQFTSRTPPTVRDWSVFKRIAAASGGTWEVIEEGDVRTILVPSWALVSLDFSDARNSEGYRICQASLKQMRDRARTADARFLVVLIPTKELVFAQVVKPTRMSETFARLIDAEEAMWRQTKTFCEQADIPYVDTLPYLRNSFSASEQPYLPAPENHPNAVGQRAIAAAVLASLRERGWSDP